MRCHICDSSIELPKIDPHDKKKLLPCETCLEVIRSISSDFTKDEEDHLGRVPMLDEAFDEIEPIY